MSASDVTTPEEGGIAIVGMAGRFPGARDVQTFWRNLRNGICSIESLRPEEIEPERFHGIDSSSPRFVPVASCIAEADCFDAGFFGFSPREAQMMDPQHRVFLECAWHALEDAALLPEHFSGSIGVVAGSTMSRYLFNCLSRADLVAAIGIDSIAIGNNVDFLPTMCSYKLDLRGPSVAVQTACSTSLVAVHMACQMLLGYEADAMLAGGVAIRVPQRTGYMYSEGGIVSPDGSCRAFDAAAAGTVFGNGAGVLVLQRLQDALRSGRQIYAVIRGTAINNDGHGKVGFTAPGVEGQARAILECQAAAGVRSESIGYVEAHGTGTRVGDPIEIAALSKAFRHTTGNACCALSSVKPNIGHLDAAAGIAGLIKAAMVVRHGEIPPTVNYSSPNPQIDFSKTPFYVSTELEQWDTRGRPLPRFAAVSSFGIGGTNAHAILEEPPQSEPSCQGLREPNPQRLLVVSARTPQSLNVACQRLAEALSTPDHFASPETALADCARTLALGRRPFEHRRYVVGQSLNDVIGALRASGHEHSSQVASDYPVAFMFSGQGTRMIGAGRELYTAEPVFADAMHQCAQILSDIAGLKLLETLLSPDSSAAPHALWLEQTDMAQIMLFSLQYALAQLWLSWGIQPTAVIGHSLGEYVAACVAGVFTLEDALRVVAERGRLMQQLAPGRMLAVMLGEVEMERILPPQLSIAAVNGPQSCVVSGQPEAVEQFKQRLRGLNIRCTTLLTRRAFHSPMMAPVVADLEQIVRSVKRQAPSIALICGVTGDWMSAEDAVDPGYWSRHMLGTVRFADGVRTLAGQGRALLEVGWGQILCTLARETLNGASNATLSSVAAHTDGRGEARDMLETAGLLWSRGAQIDWAGFYRHRQGRFISLPGYPFARDRHWVEPDTAVQPVRGTPAAAGHAIAKQQDIRAWFRQPAWHRAEHVLSTTHTAAAVPERWLIFADGAGLADAVAARLQKRGDLVVVIGIGGEIEITECAHFEALLRRLDEQGETPTRFAHFWSIRTEPPDTAAKGCSVQEVDAGYRSGLSLLQALIRRGGGATRAVWFVSSVAHDVVGNEPIVPERSMLLGLCRVASQEAPWLICRSLDVPVLELEDLEPLSAAVECELSADSDETLIALRAGQRWVLDFHPICVPPPSGSRLRRGGVYLITGGLGRFGMVVTRHLVSQYDAAVILTTRGHSGGSYGSEDADPARRARTPWLENIAKSGARVEVAEVDVADVENMSALIRGIRGRYGALHGVIHAAGIIGDVTHRSILETDDDHSRTMFHAKVSGVVSLRSALGAGDIDFVMLVSSLSPILGGLGLAAYAAANQFMDAFASRCQRQGDRAWLSINWEGWAREAHANETLGVGAELARLTMTDAEITECLERALALSGLHRMTVATGELAERIRRWSTVSGLRKLAGAEDASRPDHPPEPATDPTTEIRSIARALLGIGDLADDEDLLKRGANSLTAIQLIGRIRERFGVDLPMRTLFENPTVAGLGVAVSLRTGRATEGLLDLLEEIEELNEDELDPVLSGEPSGRDRVISAAIAGGIDR